MGTRDSITMIAQSGRLHSLWLSYLMLVIVSLAAPCFAEETMAVIVNRGNPISGTSEELNNLVARIFLKQQKDWPNDISCRTYDREQDSLEHQQFIERVLNMSEGRLLAHWGKMKQLSGETPPRVIRSSSILLRFIAKHKGGVGIIKQEEVSKLPSSIKVLFTF